MTFEGSSTLTSCIKWINSRMDHLRHWGFLGQAMNANPIFKSLAGGTGVFDSSVTAAERTAGIMLNDGFVERKPSYAEAPVGASSMGFPCHPWAMIPPNINQPAPEQQHMDIKVEEMHGVLGVEESKEVVNGNSSAKPGKTRKKRASKKDNSVMELNPKTLKRKATNKDANFMFHVQSDKKNLDIIVNGATYDISTIPGPICSCTGTPHQCYKWGVGGWQSSCCTTSMSVYPLPLSHTRPGARIAGRKMSIGAYRKVLEKVAAEGHELSTSVDLKNYWAKHGTNKFVTIR